MSERRYYESNTIIRASAGTGKTFALATRFIRLMLLDGVPPERIVALTFSRAAAQEIYAKILDRLCDAAGNDMAAEREWKRLLEDFEQNRVPDAAAKLAVIRSNPPAHAASDFAHLLRRLTDTQHFGTIATLDSFILRIVRYFPMEMGFQNAVTVLDPADENAAVDDAVRSALAKTDGSTADIAQAFRNAKAGECPRQCIEAIACILGREGWRDFVIAHPACIDGERRWTVVNMAKRLGVDLNSVCPDLSGIPFNDIGRKNAVSPEERFVKLARKYDGSTGPLETSDSVKSLMRFFWEHPEATSYAYKYYGNFTLNCGTEGAAAIRGAIRHMMNVYLKRQLEIVEAKIRLVEAVEREYGRMTRRMGKLTFGDFTKYSSDREFSERGIARQNVEFRFDARFDHWTLDEFQDTSELQWKCLRELVENAANDGGADESRTVMAVGDMKQSIYTWRGASAQPFEEILRWPAFDGCVRNLSDSHRYGPAIADFINRVFGPGNIRLGEVIPAACANAVESWCAGWVDHVSQEPQDYVKVIAAPSDDGNNDDDEAILLALGRELTGLWKRHETIRSTETVGVLVRSNDKGRKVAEYLRNRCRLPVVWEGVAPVSDNPVVQAVLALLKLAEHTSDTAAWTVAHELIDIAPIALPGCRDLASASAMAAGLLARQGLSRTLRDWCGRLIGCGRFAANGLTAAKLRQLVELAVAFENRVSADVGMVAFADFVEQSGTREIAVSPEFVRVLTIHRSKGLGIDHVFVPLFEADRSKSAIDAPKNSAPLFDGSEWVLSHLQKGSERFNALVAEAHTHMRNGCFAESLRTYYVALTRAKKSMYVIFPSDEELPADCSKGLLMRDIIRSGLRNALPFESGVVPDLGVRDKAAVIRASWPKTGKRIRIERTSPSHGGGKSSRDRKVADLFGEEYGAAARRGTEVHAMYAKIEWLDAERTRLPGAQLNDIEQRILSTEFRAAFVKPSPDASVWRERSYELCLSQPSAANAQSSVWETGQFDRVVFAGTGASRSAVIYDFKTNSRESGETAEAFVGRMRRLYSAQMAAYRQALHRLTKIPPDHIETRLLLEATGQAVAV